MVCAAEGILCFPVQVTAPVYSQLSFSPGTALRKTLCCGKENAKLTRRANHGIHIGCDTPNDQCLNGPLLPREKLCWRTEQSIWLRQPLLNESLKNILTFQCMFKSQWLMCTADSHNAACLGRHLPSASLPLYPHCPAVHLESYSHSSQSVWWM